MILKRDNDLQKHTQNIRYSIELILGLQQYIEILIYSLTPLSQYFIVKVLSISLI